MSDLIDQEGGAEAVIDLAALRRNLRFLQTRVSPAEVMVVVKNDAYGHGLVPVARVVQEERVRWIGTLDLPTAATLRRAGIERSVRLFAWFLAPDDDFAGAIEHGIDLGVSTVAQLEMIADAYRSIPARVHLKIDTGLHRNGARAEDWGNFVARAVEFARRGRIEIIAAWTHIAEASDEEDSASIARFEHALDVAAEVGVVFPLRHLAASSAGFSRHDARFDLVRFGAFLYGLPPGEGPSARGLQLEQVMTLQTTVSEVVHQADGGFRASIPLGYAHGISTRAPGRGAVSIRGRRHPIVPPIEVDQSWIALPADADVAVGDTAVVWGTGDANEMTLQEWGNATQTISEELVVRLSPRIPRRYIDDTPGG